jgi:hypothetical protein
MKPFRSIRSMTILAGAILLPLGVPAIHPHHPFPEIPSFQSSAVATETSPVVEAEQQAALLVDAIIQIESHGDARKVGRHGERGLMQLKAGTWRDMTIRLFGRPRPFDQAFDPVLNRRVGTAYLAFLQERLLLRQAQWKSDERSLLLAAYNGGPRRLMESNFDLAGMPRQTRDYVERASALHDTYLNDVAGLARPRRMAALIVPSAGI